MKISGWGNYPSVECSIKRFDDLGDLRDIIENSSDLIPRGNGRSYGDSALSENLIDVKPHNLFLDLDSVNGLLHVQAGVTLSEILRTIVPLGWFLKVTPGTKLITVGGAIASDVHGKDHHIEGCFSECVKDLKLMLPNGEVVQCSRSENVDLFLATCGGMGLTGVILDACMALLPINSSRISQRTIKTGNLQETFEAFEKYKSMRYSVAWVDSFATGESLGRSVLTVGDFADDGELRYRERRQINVPFYFPSFTINRISGNALNKVYYSKSRDEGSTRMMDIESFFYPLDAIDNWNRIYGRHGFTQYQFVLPKDNSVEGLSEILRFVSTTGPDSFLSVLKLCGPENANYLSFPMEGYSLALDFKINERVFGQLCELDAIVTKFGGRIYLTKDSRVSQSTFEAGYPKLAEFRAIRKTYRMSQKFNSLQSRRLGL